MQEKIEFSSFIVFILQYIHHIHIGIPRMDSQWHPGQPGGTDMRAKALALGGPVFTPQFRAVNFPLEKTGEGRWF